MAWNTEETTDGLISRQDAEAAIVEKARDAGIDGTFKVFYDGALIADPSQLPERVDMTKVRVSEVMNQA